MKKYISFILENNSMKDVSYDECKDIFLKNCKEFDLDNILIYRSFLIFKSGPIIIDPKEYERRSANTKNYYTYIIDNSENWKDYPKRKNSLICSTERKKQWIVIPFDGSKWGVCPDVDMWWSFDLKDISGNLMDFNDAVDDIVKILIPDKFPFDRTKEIFFDTLKDLSNILKHIDKEKFTEIVNIFYGSDIYTHWKIHSLFDYLKRFDDVRTALEELLKPKNFNLLNYKDLINTSINNEVWTDSKCILFPANSIDILKGFRD